MTPIRALAAGAILVLAIGCSREGAAQRVETTPTATTAFPKPDRPVAEIVSPRWSDDADRDRIDEAGQIARALGLKPGMAVADIGAGSGYHTFRLAKVVGDSGRIYAEDILPQYLKPLSDEVARRGVKNITLVQGAADDPKLPGGQIDAAIMVHMYHEITQPYGLLYNLAPAFKAGGKLAIIDNDAPPERHGTPVALLRCELAAVGYKELRFTKLEGDPAYVAVFAPPAPQARPQPGQIKACKG